MADIEEPAALAARRILRSEIPPSPDSPEDDPAVEGLLQTFFSLVQLIPETPVPDDVAGRIEGLLRTTPGEKPITPRPAAGPARRLTAVVTHRVRVPAVALIFLVAGLILSLVANGLLSRARGFRPEQAVYLAGTESAAAARGVAMHDGSTLVVHADGLAELTTGYRYIAWEITDQGPGHLGTMTMLSRDSARLIVSRERVGPLIVVTIESGAAPSGPTGPRVLVGRAGS
jgi:hypothetical protein